MERSNCLIFALALRLRWGGQILRFPSWYYRGPHFMWRSECGRFIADYVPIVRKKGPNGRKRWLPRPIFRGRVRLVLVGAELRGDQQFDFCETQTALRNKKGCG